MSQLPDFDGATYRHALDHARLGKQLMRVGYMMADGHWRTLRQIAAVTSDPEASISARLRDLRKRKFGGHTVERERISGGLYRYRIVLAGRERDWDDPVREPAPDPPKTLPPRQLALVEPWKDKG